MAADRLTIQTMALAAVRVPLPRPLAVSTFQLPGVDTCCLTLRTREGVNGVGWCFAFGPERLRALCAMVRDLFGLLVGRDPRETEANWEAMRRSVSFVGREGISAMAIGALDTACWDIAAKAAGEPLWRFLGGEKREIPAYASEGLWLNLSEEELRREAAALAARGFRAVKHRVGKPDLAEDVARTRAVREAVGPGITLMADANQGWSPEEAKEACRALQEFDLYWIEEPVDHEDYAGCAAVARESETPICTGETNYGPAGMRRLLEAGAADILMPDLARLGGITGWRKAAALAREFGKPVTPHLYHEVSAHLMSPEPHAVWCECMPWWEPVWKEPMAFEGGALQLRDTPGIGVEWNEEALRKFTP